MNASADRAALSLADARVRLEGAVERLEAAEPKLAALVNVLRSPRWRTELASAPERLDELIRAAGALERDLESARRLHARSPCPELQELLDGVTEAWDGIAAHARANGIPSPSLEALLSRLRQHAIDELPVAVASGEDIVATRGTKSYGWWAWIAAGGALEATGFLSDLASHPAFGHVIGIGAAAVGLLAMGAGALRRERRAGRVVLTTDRVVLEPGGADPVDVRLSELSPGAVRTSPTGTTLELAGQRALKITGVLRGLSLATEIELERWLHTRRASPPQAPRRWAMRVVPTHSGAIPSAPTLVVLPSGFCVLPVSTLSDIRRSLGPVLGDIPRVPIPLETFCRALERLDPVEGERVIGQLAESLHVPLVTHRRVLKQRGFTNRYGFETPERIFWFEPRDYALASALQDSVEGWERREVEADPTLF